MSYFLAPLLSYVLLYKYAMLFAVVFSAAVVLPLPVNTLMVAVGAFASQGYFSFSLSLAVAVAANAAGDLVDYLIVRRYKRLPFLRKRERSPWIVRLEGYVRTHAGFTVFVTRFVGSVSVVTNALAALAGVSVGTFLVFDVLGNLADFFVVTSFGFLVGSYWEQYSGLMSTVGAILLVSLVLFLAAKAVARRRENGREGPAT